ncbi:hypothetical protein BDI4_190048 [Burkholderia diffusa]|nr:hypothetical protein BDI4_190048 [Burkholderia diffusa]
MHGSHFDISRKRGDSEINHTPGDGFRQVQVMNGLRHVQSFQ